MGVALPVGFLRVKVGLFNPAQPDEVVEAEALVDTGAIYSTVRCDILEQLGVKPIERRGLEPLRDLWRGISARLESC
jgi:predicted aspartyl protease